MFPDLFYEAQGLILSFFILSSIFIRAAIFAVHNYGSIELIY